MLIETPNIHFFCAGHADSISKLNAFDMALLNAGIGNVNLMKMSSICPPHCELVAPLKRIPQGSLVPVAYAAISSDQPNTRIASGVAIAYPEDPEHCGLIMEYSNHGTKEEIEEQVRHMATIGMLSRGQQIHHVMSIAVEHYIMEYGATFAAVVLWNR
jgi:arginine decarboxylase